MPRNILVTNDDGIDSPGLWTLVRAVAPLGTVYVIAPTENQSAVGAGLTLRRELKWTAYEEAPVEGVEAWHVNGTPGDCVIIGMRSIISERVDLIVSGVNTGPNLGHDILASGTVGGALQGHFRDVNSIAFSQVMEAEDAATFDWSTPQRICEGVVKAAAELAGPFFLNVNMPAVSLENVEGVLVTRMGRHGFMRLDQMGQKSGVIEKEIDPHLNPDTPPGTDLWAISHNYVSVSPLQANLTDHRLIDVLGDRLNAELEV